MFKPILLQMRSKLVGGSEKTTCKRGYLGWASKNGQEFSRRRIFTAMGLSPQAPVIPLLGSVCQTGCQPVFFSCILSKENCVCLLHVPRPKISALCCHIEEGQRGETELHTFIVSPIMEKTKVSPVLAIPLEYVAPLEMSFMTHFPLLIENDTQWVFLVLS